MADFLDSVRRDCWDLEAFIQLFSPAEDRFRRVAPNRRFICLRSCSSPAARHIQIIRSLNVFLHVSHGRRIIVAIGIVNDFVHRLNIIQVRFFAGIAAISDWNLGRLYVDFPRV